VPDTIITSTAVRARDTARLAATAMGYDGPMNETRRVYAASGDELCALLRDAAGDQDSVLLVGHNPGMEELLGILLAAGSEIGVRMPTAALACVTIEIDDWHDVTPGSGILQWLLTPRIVAPLLGGTKRR
jgi:phosphohistidine phosphatase